MGRQSPSLRPLARSPGGPPLHPAPLRLRVLGAVTVRAADDPPSYSRITQPRQLALLCYLALARPRGLHARDTLMALLWPEHDDAHARRALRNALHGVRRRLGREVVVSAGESLVGLDARHLDCDAHDLEHEAAVDDVDGLEPLHGLHVRGARALDAWLDGERGRLRALLARRAARARSAVASTPASAPRRLHAHDALSLYERGHYLLLRAAAGGAAEELHRARAYFERALDVDGSFAPAMAGLANFHAVAGRRGVLRPFFETFARAIEFSERARALDPTLAVPHVHFGVKALYLDGDWERAGEEFATAVAKEPEYAEGHRFYGVWLGMMRRDQEALREMETAARLEPDIPHMLSSLAAARLAAGDAAGAEDALRRTLALDPQHRPARERLLRVLEAAGRFEEAVAERSRAPALPRADTFAAAWASDGERGYIAARRRELRELAEALEARVMDAHDDPANDLFDPPAVRLVAALAQLGEWGRAHAWRLQATAERPALARWFASLPELRAAPSRR